MVTALSIVFSTESLERQISRSIESNDCCCCFCSWTVSLGGGTEAPPMCAIHESLLWFFLSAKAWAEEERRMGCAVWWIGFKFLDGCGVGEPDFSRGVMELEA